MYTGRHTDKKLSGGNTELDKVYLCDRDEDMTRSHSKIMRDPVGCIRGDRGHGTGGKRRKWRS